MILAKEGEKKEYMIAPEGTYQAVCFNVWDLGMQEGEWQGQKKVQHKIIVGWEIDEKIPTGEYEGKRFTIYKKYTLSLSDKASLRKDLESWRGRAFTKDELKGFDVEGLVGANCLLNVIHNKSNEKTYTNISSIMKLTKGLEKLEPENERVVPDWIKKIQDKAVSVESQIVEEKNVPNETSDDQPPF